MVCDRGKSNDAKEFDAEVSVIPIRGLACWQHRQHGL